MKHSGSRLIVALGIAAALGLSCTACLAPTNLSAQSASSLNVTSHAPAPVRQAELIRLDQTTSSIVTAPAAEAAPIQYQQQFQSNSVSRPLGEMNGIDMTVAGFTQSLQTSPYRQSSPLELEFDEEDRRRIDAGYTLYASAADTGLGLDVSISPRVTFDRTENFSSTRAGAEVRIGQDLDLRGKPKNNSSWYLFAGADGEALVWDVQRAGTTGVADGLVTLQDTVTVGDVQAGVAWESPAGQMSVSYIEREYEYRNGAISRTGDEDFVALTLTWRR